MFGFFVKCFPLSTGFVNYANLACLQLAVLYRCIFPEHVLPIVYSSRKPVAYGRVRQGWHLALLIRHMFLFL